MQQNAHSDSPMRAGSFPTDPGLPEAIRPEVLELADGDNLRLRLGPVAKRLGDTTVRMLGYNGSIPGPTLKVRQGSEAILCPRPHPRNFTEPSLSRAAQAEPCRGSQLTRRSPA